MLVEAACDGHRQVLNVGRGVVRVEKRDALTPVREGNSGHWRHACRQRRRNQRSDLAQIQILVGVAELHRRPGVYPSRGAVDRAFQRAEAAATLIRDLISATYRGFALTKP